MQKQITFKQYLKHTNYYIETLIVDILKMHRNMIFQKEHIGILAYTAQALLKPYKM